MAISDVTVANRALQKLGAKRIESLTQDTPNARSINACYAVLRNAELARYEWAFAIKRASIAADSTDETIQSTWKRYTLPNDFITLIRDDETDGYVDWKIEGLYILSKTASPLEIKYVARIEDPNYFNPLFVETLAGRIAFECCYEIANSTTKKESIKDDYMKDLAEAKRLGFIQKAAQDTKEDPWVSARR